MSKQTNTPSAGRLYTTGDIVRQTGASVAQVNYAIGRYRIAPAQRAGIIRLYDEHAVEAIRSAIQRVGRDRGGL